MKVTIEREECIACGSCWDICPEIFEENPDDGQSQIVATYQLDGDPEEGKAPTELGDCAREAAEECPVEIIHVD